MLPIYNYSCFIAVTTNYEHKKQLHIERVLHIVCNRGGGGACFAREDLFLLQHFKPSGKNMQFNCFEAFKLDMLSKYECV